MGAEGVRGPGMSLPRQIPERRADREDPARWRKKALIVSRGSFSFRQFGKGSFLASFCLIWLAGCAGPSTAKKLHEDPSKVWAIVQTVMAQYESAREEDRTIRTDWEAEQVSTLEPPPWPSTLRARARYCVRMRGDVLEVSAVAEAYVRFGPHATRWERVDPTRLETRLLNRIEEGLKQ